MVAAIKWESTFSSQGNVLTTQLNSLANDTISAVGAEYTNSTDLNTLGWLEVNVTFSGGAPSDSVPSLNIAPSYSMDGTNYSDAFVTSFTDQNPDLIFVPVRKITGAQVLMVGPFTLPPGKTKFQLDNQTGVAFPATGSTVELFTGNYESQ